MLVDTHCHLTHEKFIGEIPELLKRAAAAGVSGVIGISSNLGEAETLQQSIPGWSWGSPPGALPRLWGTAGVHPHESGSVSQDLGAELRGLLDRFPEIVAIGECGLDYHYDFSPVEAQRRVFRTQIEVAAERGLPLVVHCRSAEEEMAGWIREAGSAGVRGVLHCFPGDEALLAVALEAGWFVSFTGMVTFSSFGGAEAVRSVPSNRYMIETDGPYLAPVPHRGKRNEPAMVTYTRDRIAGLRGIPAEQVAEETTRNARDFFGIDPAPLNPEVVP